MNFMKLSLMFLSVTLAQQSVAALSAQEALELVKLVDDRQRNSGDYTALCFVKETEKKL